MDNTNTIYNSPCIGFRSTSTMLQDSHYYTHSESGCRIGRAHTYVSSYAPTARPVLSEERLETYTTVPSLQRGNRKAPPSGSGGAGVEEPTLLPIGDVMLPLVLLALMYMVYIRNKMKRT